MGWQACRRGARGALALTPARRGAQDVAKMTLAALRTEKTVGQRITLAGPQAYTVSEVIALCERFANADADVTEARRPACAAVAGPHRSAATLSNVRPAALRVDPAWQHEVGARPRSHCDKAGSSAPGLQAAHSRSPSCASHAVFNQSCTACEPSGSRAPLCLTL